MRRAAHHTIPRVRGHRKPADTFRARWRSPATPARPMLRPTRRALGAPVFTAVLAVVAALSLSTQPAALEAQGRSGSSGLPLDAADSIRFDVDEATWLSLSIDPDGESIVFDVLGDLYRVPMSGGAAERVTSGMGFDAQPAVSPDGEWLAFISDRDGSDNLWVSRSDGSDARKLTSERQNALISPAWSPDSKYIVVTRRGRRTELRLHHIDGGSGITVGAAAGGGGGATGGGGGARPAELGATFSPDGEALYFGRATGGAGGMFPRWQVARRDMRSGTVDVITQAEGSAIRPVVSPDGRFLVYGTRHETETGLRIRNLDTGADRWLVFPVQRDEQESGGAPTRDVFPSYSFTPDGTGLLFTEGGKLRRVEVATGDVSTIEFTATVALEIGPELERPYRVPQGPVRAKLVQSPQQSPDGELLAFSVLTKLYVMDLEEDATPRRLTEGDDWEFKPTWSPDGEWIAYVTWSMDGGHIWKARADGRGEPEQLTSDPAFYTDLVFSADGERIVGLRGNAYMRSQTFSEFGGLRIPLDMIWLDADGGAVNLVASSRGVGAPHMGPEADRIYVYTRQGLASMRYDGTDRRTHLRVTGPANPRAPQPPPAETVLISPDGNWALASVQKQLWVVAVPPGGGTTPAVSVRGPAVPAKRITDIGADYFGWADDGRTVTWGIGSTYYRRALESIEFRAPTADSSAADSIAAGAEDAPADSTTADSAATDSTAAAPDSVQAKDPLDLDEAVEAFRIAMEFPRAMPTGSIALRNARVITMNGDEVIERADIVVTNNRFASVGPAGAVSIPDGAHEVDLTGKTIVPGFIDTHAHWEFRTHDVLEPLNWSLLANLAYGVTAGLDVQTATNDYFAYQDLVETGQALGQRAFMTGPGIFSGNDFRSYEATLAYLKRYTEHYRTPNIKSYMVGNRQQRQWVVKAANELGLMPTTEGGRDMKLDLTHAIDGFWGNEHTLPVTPIFEDVVQLYAQTKTTYTPTLLVQYGGPIAEEYFYTTTDIHDDEKLNRFYPHNRIDEMSRRRRIWLRHDEFTFSDASTDAARIQRAGGLVGVGGHGQLQGLGYHWEMWAMGMGDMTEREVLRAATIDGARIIGIAEDLGSIEVGKLADLVVLDANPLDDLRNTNTVGWVMKNGELYDANTLDQVWPEAKPLPELWWWSQGPTDFRGQNQPSGTGETGN